MIKIQIKRTQKNGKEPREQIPANKYNITMNIDNQAWQTIQIDITINETIEHVLNLLKTIPFATVEIENPETWEVNYLNGPIGFNEKQHVQVVTTA